MKQKIAILAFALIVCRANSQEPASRRPADLSDPAIHALKKPNRDAALLAFRLAMSLNDVDSAHNWSVRIEKLDIKAKKIDAHEAHTGRLKELLENSKRVYEAGREHSSNQSYQPIFKSQYAYVAAQFYYLEAVEEAADEKK